MKRCQSLVDKHGVRMFVTSEGVGRKLKWNVSTPRFPPLVCRAHDNF